MPLLAKSPKQAVNYWRDDRCAKAFWSQHEMPPYQELLNDTMDWVDVHAGERWLDLGCGGGRLTRAIWTKSEGTVAEILGADVAALNAVAYEKMQQSLQPVPGNRVQFQQVDFSNGLPWKDANQFDGVVRGLAIQYAESYSETEGRWTSEAYDRVLHDVYHILKPGGRFVFSGIVPNPKWRRVAMGALKGFWSSRRKFRYLGKLWGMCSYGGWLTRESRKGRFHYLSAEAIAEKLTKLGFTAIEHRLSYAKQSVIIRCVKRGHS